MRQRGRIEFWEWWCRRYLVSSYLVSYLVSGFIQPNFLRMYKSLILIYLGCINHWSDSIWSIVYRPWAHTTYLRQDIGAYTREGNQNDKRTLQTCLQRKIDEKWIIKYGKERPAHQTYHQMLHYDEELSAVAFALHRLWPNPKECYHCDRQTVDLPRTSAAALCNLMEKIYTEKRITSICN